MNNEERILTLLDELKIGQARLEAGQAKLEGDVSALIYGQAKLEGDVSALIIGQEKLESDLASINKTVTRIENEHGDKLDALFDGYQRLNAKISRIDEHVTMQDDVILKRVFPVTMNH